MSKHTEIAEASPVQVALEGWRGRPDLFAHIIRVAERVTTGSVAQASITGVSVTTGQPPVPSTLTVDVTVGDDHETFSSADDFMLQVSADALRHFNSILIEASGERGTISLRFLWRRPWWKPSSSLTDMSSDAIVELQLVGEAEWRDDSRKILQASLRRGWRTIHWKGMSAALVAVGIAAAAGAIALFASYLLGFNDPSTLGWITLGASSMGLILGAFGGSWVFPTLEISPKGESNAWRTVKVIAPVVASLALAAVSKSLFG